MPNLNINFQTAPRWGSPVALALLVSAAAVFGLTVQSAWEADEALQKLQEKQRRGEKAKASAPRRLAAEPKAAAIQPSTTQALAQLQVPWDAVLGELEQAGNKNVALLSIEAQGAARRVRIQAESKSMANALQYLAALRDLPLVQSAELTSHEEKAVNGIAVLRFMVDLQWKAPV
jgi:heme exporter protein D